MSATMHMRRRRRGRCLELAEIAARAGDTAVGALIVCGNAVVAEGVERTRTTLDPSAAEVEAIRRACQHLDPLDLRGCIRPHVERFSLTDVRQAYDRLGAGRLKGRAVIIPGASAA